MASINLKHSSGNGTILNSPAANPSADITLKLPSTTGSAGQVLKIASANHSSTNAELEFGAEGASGKILQVLQVTNNNVVSQSSGGVTTFYDISGLTLNITPASASNKILIRFVVNFGCSNGDSNGLIRLLKNGSIITAFHGADGTVANGANFTRFSSQWQIFPFNNEFLDTAGGTSAITYKLQWSTESGRTIYLNRRGGSAEYGTVSYITAQEIAA
tara:strand:- start:611 stop:1261 length:651 start_codon:yes stop_codon:yes gene_type:complete